MIDQNTSSSFQESELREQVKTLEDSLANAEAQAKTYYEKVCDVIVKIFFFFHGHEIFHLQISASLNDTIQWNKAHICKRSFSVWCPVA